MNRTNRLVVIGPFVRNPTQQQQKPVFTYREVDQNRLLSATINE
ncbi:hypothetical protein [Spirosoma oryzicola]|nr:hypothetical protein [Spirosoma oryzicola]